MRLAGLKTNATTGLVSAILWLGHSGAQEYVLFKVQQVADKPRQQVERVLGEASGIVDDVFTTARGYSYPALRASYLNGVVEVTYLEGGARYLRIWIEKLAGKYRDYVYPKDAWTVIGELGLDRKTPADLSTPSVTRWRNLPDVYEISVFAAPENRIWYVHIMTSRIYE